MKEVNSKTRIRILTSLVVVIAGIVLARLFFLQVLETENYKALADHQYISPVTDAFDRGSIFFKGRDGDLISAATLKNGFKIIGSPDKIINPENEYTELSSILTLDHDTFIARMSKKNDSHEEIAVKVGKDDADKIQKLGLPGISIETQKWRVYPGGPLAAQTLGFVAYKGDELSGRYGVERQYDTTLERTKTNGEVNFFAEVFDNIKDSVFANEQSQGDVVLTIEPQVQAELELQINEIQKAYSAQRVGGIIMDPKTGALYALGTAPGFDLNEFSKVQDPLTFGNPLVENVYEMGSVIKPLVMAAALDAKVVTPQTTYLDKGSVVVADRTIYNFDKRGRGIASMQDVLNQSLNTGMVFVEQHLGKEKMHEYLTAYGLEEKTGIDLPGEIKSLTSNLRNNNDVEFANAAFGQGIALTPIATVRAFASLANGGTLVTPHILDKIVYHEGTTSFVPDYPTRPVKITKESAEELTGMLVTVYDKALLGGKYKMEHYSIAAKTGTAQVAKENGAGYYDDKHLHSFFGYFPAYDPKFLVFLFALDPKGVNYAAYSLADPFSHIAKFLLNYYNVPPDR